MRKSLLSLIILFILLTTYYPKLEFFNNLKINIEEIEIENNSILTSDEIKKNLSFLYNKNLIFLKRIDIEHKLKNETFIQSFIVKKIYPNKVKIKIYEKKPIALLQEEKKKFYLSDKGEKIRFKKIKKFENLPVVFGKGKNFSSLYRNLQNIKFPLKLIKSYHFFESGRWDIIMRDNKVIKLPVQNYISSLQNFMDSKNNNSFNNYKIFDYRIKDQLILN